MAETETGPPAKKIDKSDVYGLFDYEWRNEHGYPVLSAGKIAKTLIEENPDIQELSNQTVRNHLQTLQNEGKLERIELGSRTVVWTKPNDQINPSDGHSQGATVGIIGQLLWGGSLLAMLSFGFVLSNVSNGAMAFYGAIIVIFLIMILYFVRVYRSIGFRQKVTGR